VAALVAASSLR
jgi:60 kDa SS-A/Ro ribonucleoprotein